jgi:sugar O-acyltransferase (sialic acid O-acetyltransferase NeuD family)
MSHEVIIFGAGGMAREVYEWSFRNGDKSSIGDVVGYSSDLGVTPEFEAFTGLSFIDIKAAMASYPGVRVLLCIGDPITRKRVAKTIIEIGAELHTFIHPSALVAESAQIGAGTVVYPFVVVSSNARVGQGCVINSYTGVGHDVTMGDFCVVSAQVDLTGSVQLGEGVFIGSGARVLPKKKIGAYSKIGAGVTVIRSLVAHSVVLPEPNKRMR